MTKGRYIKEPWVNEKAFNLNCMVKLEFYVPLEACEQVKEAIFSVGAGEIGNYRRCCWQTLGEGQFEPMMGSSPSIGKLGVLEFLKEIKVEMVCRESIIKDVIEKLKATHPYEEPAYNVTQILDF